MIVLGVDYGRAHVGVALGDTETNLAVPLATVEERNEELVIAALRDLARTHSATTVVVGLPVALSGTESSHGFRQEVESFAKRLHQATNLPTVLIDERFSSAAAVTLQREGSRADEHALAAAVILQMYLDRAGQNSKVAESAENF